MSRALRITFFGALGFIGLLAFGAAALHLLLDPSRYKARLEATASQALGMEVRVGGRSGIALFPVLVTLEDVSVRNAGVDVASAREARLGVALLPLLWKEVRIEKIELGHLRISIERSRDGRLNLQGPQVAAAGTSPGLDWPNVAVTDGTVVYADKRSGQGFEATDCRADVRRLRLPAGDPPDPMLKHLSFTAELACGQVRHDGITASDLKFTADAKDAVIVVEPATLRVFGARGSANIRTDFSGAVPLYRVHFSLAQFPIEEFFKTMSSPRAATGRMDLVADLSMQGRAEREMRQTLQGRISLQGRNLTISGSDLDREFSRFESSQHFNLVDMGAFFLAGPLGLVATKGYDFASLSRGTGVGSEIRTLVSDWKVEHGVAQALDVAMTTPKNRIALRGRLDFVNDRFDDVTVALIDAKGCATVEQKIRGSFSNPVVEQPSPLASLAGPALNLLKQGRALLQGGHCDVFYAGSVVAPR